MFLVSAVKASFLDLIYNGAGMVVYLLLLKFSMPKQKAVVFMLNTKDNATHACHNSIVV